MLRKLNQSILGGLAAILVATVMIVVIELIRNYLV